MEEVEKNPRLPPPEQIRLAISLFIACAYEQAPSPSAQRFVPPETFEPRLWLMSDFIERDPPNSPLGTIRSFAMRIGNSLYPNMKLRLSRPPKDAIYIFGVDSHDAILKAPPGSPDAKPLEELKKHNAQLAGRILAAWTQAGLPTEASYLRDKIRQAGDQAPQSR